MTDTEAGGAQDRIPVCVLTGFLGAGKSTLLNFVLRHPRMHGTAVVINEYGAVGIDHHLVESAPDDTVLIEDGCICCTARGRLADTLIDLFERMRRRSIPLRRVVIETTGLAAPGPILQQLLRHPGVAERFVIDQVVTLIDAVNAGHTLEHHDLAVQQITAADGLLITKTDQVTPEAAARLESRLREMNPDAALERVHHGAVSPDRLFSVVPRSPAAFTNETLFSNVDRLRLTPDRMPTQSALLSRSPSGVAPADQDIQTFSLILETPLPERHAFGWLEFLRTLCGPTLLRVKGLLNIENQSGPTVVHGVQQVLHPAVQLDAWPDADRRSRLVFITRGWGQDVVASTLAYLRAPPPHSQNHDHNRSRH